MKNRETHSMSYLICKDHPLWATMKTMMDRISQRRVNSHSSHSTKVETSLTTDTVGIINRLTRIRKSRLRSLFKPVITISLVLRVSEHCPSRTYWLNPRYLRCPRTALVNSKDSAIKSCTWLSMSLTARTLR